MDRPEVVVRVQLRHNDDLVQYILSEERGEGGASFIQGVASTVVIKHHSFHSLSRRRSEIHH
jgi:hypothetical protein